MYRYFLKPLFDFLVAFIGFLIVLLPFFILVLAVKIDSRGPVFFKQLRVGKNKKLFKIYKFRTMRTDTPKDTPTHLLGDANRYITKVGRFLRKTSLDELPQIFNILAGKMSIIGPRPALWNQDDLIAARDEVGANGVRPGLTGWAQVNGRDELPIAEKAKLDGEYIKRMGFFFDCKVFFKTIGKVFRSEGVVEGGTGTLKKQPETGIEQTETDTMEMERITEEAATVQEEILTAAEQPDSVEIAAPLADENSAKETEVVENPGDEKETDGSPDDGKGTDVEEYLNHRGE